MLVVKTPTRKGMLRQMLRSRAPGLTCTFPACTARKNAGHSPCVFNCLLDKLLYVHRSFTEGEVTNYHKCAATKHTFGNRTIFPVIHSVLYSTYEERNPNSLFIISKKFSDTDLCTIWFYFFINNLKKEQIHLQIIGEIE